MMKLKFVIIYSLCVMINSQCAIIQDSAQYDHLGYGNDAMISNGELYVIKNYIKKNQIIFDVGANVGEWSTIAFKEHPQIKIYAFEPIPALFKTLQRGLKNKSAIPCNIALSNAIGKTTIFYYPKLSGMSSFYNRPVMQTLSQAKPTVINIKTDTLDNFCLQKNIPHIDFLKIDTEGNELKVLLGALNLLRNKAISTIQFEYGGCYPDAGITLKEVYHLLTSYDYSIYRILPNKLIHIINWRDALENATYSNYLAIANI